MRILPRAQNPQWGYGVQFLHSQMGILTGSVLINMDCFWTVSPVSVSALENGNSYPTPFYQGQKGGSKGGGALWTPPKLPKVS